MERPNAVGFEDSSASKVRLLDNPIWNALGTVQGRLAIGDGLARRFPQEIGPLSGLVEQTSAAYEALCLLTEPGGNVALFLESPVEVREGWSVVREGLMRQMIWPEEASLRSTPLPEKSELRLLTPEDVPAMVALAELTEPGPFRRRTSELGEFFGVFESGRLMAMAGQRLRLPGLTEISAVCTHPDARGRGYAGAAMSKVITTILARGETPLLHVFAANYGAIRVYEALGFRRRRDLHLAALKRSE